VFTNARFASLYSVDPTRAVAGEPISSFIKAMHPDDRPQVNERIERALQTGEDYTAEYRLVQHDQSIRWVHARGRCHRNAQGLPLRFTGVVFDITERKQSEEALAHYAEELKRSNEDLEQFAHVASHDLRSPLNSVLTFTELILRRQGDAVEEELKFFLETVRDNAKRMGELISALLIYSRLNDVEANEPTPVSSLSAYEGAIANLRAAIAESHAEIERGELPEVLSNATQLCQVFQNLISNAIQYRGAARPRIFVSAERKDRFWQFSVSDNGPGIRAAYHSLIFQPFKRLHGEERPGSGIGLAFCRKFIERQGGAIWVESEEGNGATFRFTVRSVK
jgi:light-regulated signal transduction histidine kinase (bacteriophytochrome)